MWKNSKGMTSDIDPSMFTEMFKEGRIDVNTLSAILDQLPSELGSQLRNVQQVVTKVDPVGTQGRINMPGIMEMGGGSCVIYINLIGPLSYCPINKLIYYLLSYLTCFVYKAPVITQLYLEVGKKQDLVFFSSTPI